MTHTVLQTRIQSSRRSMYNIIVSENTARVCVRCVQCTTYNVRRTMYNVHCTSYKISPRIRIFKDTQCYFRCTIYRVHYTQCISHAPYIYAYTLRKHTLFINICRKLYAINTLYTVQCTLYKKHCTMYTVHLTIYTIHYTLNIQCAVC